MPASCARSSCRQPPWPRSPAGKGQPAPIELALPSLETLERQINALRDLCWQVAGVERSAHPLAQALRQVLQQRQQLEAGPAWRGLQSLRSGQVGLVQPADVPALKGLQELHQRQVLAGLLIEAALFRTESRGGHHRRDKRMVHHDRSPGT